MICRSKLSISPACHNRVTWLAVSAQLLALRAVVRFKPLGQAPPLWHHNAISWNLETDTWKARVNINWILYVTCNSPSDIPQGVSSQLLTPLRISGGPHHVTRQFYLYIILLWGAWCVLCSLCIDVQQFSRNKENNALQWMCFEEV